MQNKTCKKCHALFVPLKKNDDYCQLCKIEDHIKGGKYLNLKFKGKEKHGLRR